MQLPLSVVRAGSERVSEKGYTRNISSGGVLFTSERKSDVGGPIEYVITLNKQLDQAVSLRCVGKVVRCEALPSDQPDHSTHFYAVAATLERYEFLRSDA